MEGEIVLLNCKFPLHFSFLTFQRTSPGFFFRKCVPLLIWGKNGCQLRRSCCAHHGLRWRLFAPEHATHPLSALNNGGAAATPLRAHQRLSAQRRAAPIVGHGRRHQCPFAPLLRPGARRKRAQGQTEDGGRLSGTAIGAETGAVSSQKNGERKAVPGEVERFSTRISLRCVKKVRHAHTERLSSDVRVRLE